MNLQYSGEETIAADRATVWKAITDPAWVGRCIPEVVDVTVHDPTHFDAVAKVGVGPVRGNFKFKFELVPSAAGDRMDMIISGGGLGSALRYGVGRAALSDRRLGLRPAPLRLGGRATARARVRDRWDVTRRTPGVARRPASISNHQ